MCGGGAPKVVQRDPKAEAEAAANEAAMKANSEAAARRRRKQESSLLASGAQGVKGQAGASLLASAQGKDTLGS
jgi:hypothetical protein